MMTLKIFWDNQKSGDDLGVIFICKNSVAYRQKYAL